MAVDQTVKSPQIANRDANPRVLNSPQNGGDGVCHETYGSATIPAALSITSVVRLCQVPSNARVHSVQFHSAAQGAGAFDVGLYQATSNGGAVVDADLFGSAISAASQVKSTDIIEESAEYTPAEMEKPLWEVLGLTADPHRFYDVCATVATTAVTTGTGRLGVRVGYVR